MSSTTLRSAKPHREAHRETNSFRDVILGGQDGLVNILGIVLGVIAGGGSTGEGTYSAVTLVGDWRRKGLEMAVIGLGAAAIGFALGRLFHAAGA